VAGGFEMFMLARVRLCRCWLV